jgi:hypothetical protein
MDRADNEFLVQLLTLQQDGSAAISAPSNWRESPLLEVETDLDAIISDLCRRIPVGKGEDTKACWHFFVGAPGNGKSAAVGRIYRELRSAGYEFRTEGRDLLEDLAPDEIPYVAHLREGEKGYVTAWLAQDASVVRNPYSPDVDPARELVQLMRDAWTERVSLIVCTNRGVLEKAFRSVQLEPQQNKAPWAKALRRAANPDPRVREDPLELPFGDSRSKARGFQSFLFGSTYLERTSLLVGSSVFERLVSRAVVQEHWTACAQCAVAGSCPFKANRDNLADESERPVLLRLLQRAEVLSGQNIVFREAVALVSFLLAGCARDYVGCTPCDWVHDRAEADDLFGLLSRRFYMCLFSSHSPYGLEEDPALRTEQRKQLRKLRAEGPTATGRATRALKYAIGSTTRLSTDVGLSRLVGSAGVLSRLDPLREGLSRRFYEKWDGPLDSLKRADSPLVSQLELDCFELWFDIEKRTDLPQVDPVLTLRFLRRWITAVTFRLGALDGDEFAFKEELDEILDVLAYRAPEGRLDEECAQADDRPGRKHYEPRDSDHIWEWWPHGA